MTLIDTSVWINHFRQADARLSSLLAKNEAGVHSFVIGELAAGNVPKREELLQDLFGHPRAGMASEEEVHYLVQSRRLWGKGLGWIDLHILAATRLAGWRLYTADAAMAKVAVEMGIECL